MSATNIQLVEVDDRTVNLAKSKIPARKEILDWSIAATALFLLAPLMLVVACAIRIESAGPAIFKQRRGGHAGTTFRILKFRTMSVQEDGNQLTQARDHDPRLTAIGYWLRRTSIDELPQLVNVLRGEMSLVGPRPHAVAHDDHYGPLIKGYEIRYRVKPGLTGWAQVNGARGPTPDLGSMVHRVQLDVWYVRNHRFSLDLLIILKTVLGAAWGKGAL